MASPVTYFPDGAPVQRGVSFSPRTVAKNDPAHGSNNIQLFQSMPDPERQSDEQGVGRSPGFRWAHMPHVVQFSDASLTNQADHPTDAMATRPEQGGWSAARFFEQAASQHHVFPMPIVIEQAPTHAYTGLGVVPA